MKDKQYYLHTQIYSCPYATTLVKFICPQDASFKVLHHFYIASIVIIVHAL